MTRRGPRPVVKEAARAFLLRRGKAGATAREIGEAIIEATGRRMGRGADRVAQLRAGGMKLVVVEVRTIHERVRRMRRRTMGDAGEMIEMMAKKKVKVYALEVDDEQE